jgi:uracil-DNA glycosylase
MTMSAVDIAIREKERALTLVTDARNQFPDLVAARKSCRLCIDRNPDRIVAGAEFDFDPDVVSYWSQWLGHPNPHILIVGQDFADVEYFKSYRGFDEPDNSTNNKLYELLSHAGLANIGSPPHADTNTRVFLTNSILCLKRPPMNAPILDWWVKTCATNHLRPLVERLKPPIVVAMGVRAWQATCLALEIVGVPQKIGDAAGGEWDVRGIKVFAVGHCGPLGLANRAWKKQLDDWARIGDALKRLIQT